MEADVESSPRVPDEARSGIVVGLLGALVVRRDGEEVVLPASRKLRGLLAYLARAPQPVTRARLCDLLWDAPSDPRGELRWCLSKLRSVFDEPQCPRILSSGETVALRLDACRIDANEVDVATEAGVASLGTGRMRMLSALYRGDFAEGLEIAHSPHFSNWLTAQRRLFATWRVALLGELVRRSEPTDADADRLVEAWIELAPFDLDAHAALLGRLASRGRISDCEAHLSAAAKVFDDEGLDFGPVRELWRSLRAGTPNALRSAPPAPVGRPAEPVAVQGHAGPDEAPARGPGRASLAVMPFQDLGPRRRHGGFADGLTHDIITRLAKLRNLFIIARGSVFALAERHVDPTEAGRQLNVDYVASGTVRTLDTRVSVAVDVVEVGSARIVWSEVFEHRLDDTFAVLDDIGNSIVSSISKEVESAEQNRALLKAPDSLNAWEAYHRGLWHMYRFTRSDNLTAQQFFLESLKLDPTFARAHAGMSFTHWQNAFQRWEDHDEQTDLALRSGAQSLLADDHNPAAHWAMGRALWLGGSLDQCLHELERAVELSPNFALGHYTLSFVHSQSGDPIQAIESSNHSRHLSPFDPLLFGMLAARAMAHVRRREYEEAADWAVRAAARPNAHVIILAIAAHCLALAGRIDEGRSYVASIRKLHPGYTGDDFLNAFRFAPDAAAAFRKAARLIGLT